MCCTQKVLEGPQSVNKCPVCALVPFPPLSTDEHQESLRVLLGPSIGHRSSAEEACFGNALCSHLHPLLSSPGLWKHFENQFKWVN